MRIKSTYIFPLLLILLTALTALSCSRATSDEERIRTIIKEGAAAVEERSLKGVMRHISEDYRDDFGNDRNSVKGFLFAKMMRGEKTGVFITSVDVEIKGDVSLVEISAIFTRGKEVKSVKDLLPEEMSRERISLVFKKIDNEWKIIKGSWEGAMGTF